MGKRKWKKPQKPTCLFINAHKDKCGGLDLWSNQIAECFDSLTTMRYMSPMPHRKFKTFTGFDHRFTGTSLQTETDIFVSCSQFNPFQPTGKCRNILVLSFPRDIHKKIVAEYDTIITCSNFSAKHIKQELHKKAIVIKPHFIAGDVYSGKPKTILNVGRFFRERNGHSKYQDKLLEAFEIIIEEDPEWKLTLVGATFTKDDEAYVDYLSECCLDLGLSGNVQIYANVDRTKLLEFYDETSIYWDASGWDAEDSYEEEQCPMATIEGIFRGCYPIVYESGEYCNLSIQKYLDVDDLVQLTLFTSSRLSEKEFNECRTNHLIWAGVNYSKKSMEDEICHLVFR